MRQLLEMAAAEGLELLITEGGRHTKVMLDDRVTFVPRHREINELTARAIINQLSPKGE